MDTKAANSESSYKYVATFSGLDDTSLRQSRGYWLYANQPGNLTIPSAGGTLSGETYPWSKLRFSNGTTELNITEAVSESWIQEDFQRYEYINVGMGQFDWQWVLYDNGDNLGSWSGYFVDSHKDNLTLIRQN